MIDPTRMSLEDMAAALKRAGASISEMDVLQDVEDGAPTNSDGTLHLVHYTAWLASQVN